MLLIVYKRICMVSFYYFHIQFPSSETHFKFTNFSLHMVSFLIRTFILKIYYGIKESVFGIADVRTVLKRSIYISISLRRKSGILWHVTVYIPKEYRLRKSINFQGTLDWKIQWYFVYCYFQPKIYYYKTWNWYALCNNQLIPSLLSIWELIGQRYINASSWEVLFWFL